MPTVIGHHHTKGTKHWLASPKRHRTFLRDFIMVGPRSGQFGIVRRQVVDEDDVDARNAEAQQTVLD